MKIQNLLLLPIAQLSCFVLAGTLLPTSPVQAQGSGGAEPVLEAVVVTASRSETRLEDMPLHTTVLTREDIRNSPAQTLDQVLRNVPGLLIPGAPAYTADPTGQNIKFRGMDKKVLVLVDGIPVHDPFFTTIQWFKLPIGSVERVEIIRGGGSSLWGNLAVGGVINVVTRRPQGSEGEARLSAGSRDTWNASATRSMVLSDALSLTVSGSGFKSDGYNTAHPDYRAAFWPGRGNSSADSQNLRLAAYYKLSEATHGFVKLGYNAQDEKIGGYQFGSNQQSGPDLQAGLTHRLNEGSSLQANFWSQWIRFDKYNGAGCYAAAVFVCGASATTAATPAQQAANILQYASSYDAMDYRERGGSLMWSREQRGLVTSLQGGVDFRLLSGEDSQESYRTPTAALPAALRIQRANYGAGHQRFVGVFGQAKLVPLDPLEVTLSLRWDSYRSYKGAAVQTNYSNVASPVITSAAGGPVADKSKTALNPTLSARYDLSERLALRGSAYKAFRAPGMNNMYRTFGSANITVANPELGPETMTGKEIGFDWVARGYSLGATLFTADIKDVVANYTLNPGGVLLATGIPTAVQAICGASVGLGAPLCTGTVSYNTNGQDQRSRGLEVDAKWQPTRALSLQAYATRTLTYYTSTSTGDPVNKQLPLIPKNVVGVNLQWLATDAWTHTFDLRHNGPMTLNLTNAVTDPMQQGGYTVFSAATAWRFRKDTEWFASVVNLTDKRYTDGSASNPQGVSLALPRTLATGVRMKF